MAHSKNDAQITDFAEIAARDAYDPEGSIDPNAFERLLFQYHLPEKVKCQVLSSSGRCNHEHNWGYLGKTKDGRELLIGNECGRKYFNANEDFKSQKRVIDEKVRLQRSRAQLEAILKNRDALREQIESAQQRLFAIRQQEEFVRQSLPPSVIRAIRAKSRQATPRVNLEVAYQETDEKGRKKTRWQTQAIGSLRGLVLWTMPAGRLREVAQRAYEALESASPDASDDRKVIKEWVEGLQAVEGLLRDLDQYEQALERFTEPANLRMVMFLVGSHLDQDQVAELIRKQGGQDRGKSQTGRALGDEIRSQLRKTLGANFRVP